MRPASGLIAITPPESRGDALEHRVLRALMAEGFWRFHLRRPDWDVDRTRAFFEPLTASERAFVTVHDHHALAAELGIGGIHFNRRNPWPGGDGKNPPPALRSLSVHHPGDLDAHPEPASRFDYVFYSPVFPSTSKPGHADPEALTRFREWHRPPGLAIYALGGVTPDRLGLLRDLGFHGAAVLGDLWGESSDSEAEILGRIRRWAVASPFRNMPK